MNAAVKSTPIKRKPNSIDIKIPFHRLLVDFEVPTRKIYKVNFVRAAGYIQVRRSTIYAALHNLYKIILV